MLKTFWFIFLQAIMSNSSLSFSVLHLLCFLLFFFFACLPGAAHHTMQLLHTAFPNFGELASQRRNCGESKPIKRTTLTLESLFWACHYRWTLWKNKVGHTGYGTQYWCIYCTHTHTKCGRPSRPTVQYVLLFTECYAWCDGAVLHHFAHLLPGPVQGPGCPVW